MRRWKKIAGTCACHSDTKVLNKVVATTVEALERRCLMSTSPSSEVMPSQSGLVPVTWGGKTGFAAPGEWVIRVTGVGGSTEAQGELRLQRLLRQFRKDVEVLDRDPATGFARVRVAASAKFENVSSAFRRASGFKTLVPNLAYSASLLPNDPQFSQLTGLHNTGQTGGTTDADIDAPEAWNLTTGDASVIVAVLDTGVKYTHPDLAANIWSNPGEIAGNRIDDDRNGFVDDIRGYDFANDDPDPDDDHGHGTHVAGTIAAVGNNGVGITGVAWNSKILPLKFLSAGGVGYAYNAVKAINYVTRLRRDFGVNVRVLNCSWGGTAFDQAIKDALTAAGDAGILTVAAAGNSGNTSLSYPAAYNLPTEISVAATTPSDALAIFSTYGSTVQIGAPGQSILSTVPTSGGFEGSGSGYRSLSGTSMAAPHVAGVAALAFSQATDATAAEVRAAILAGGDTIASLGAGRTATGKRLNAMGTLNQLGIRVKSSTPSAGSTVTTAPTSFTVRLSEPIAAASLAGSDLTVNGIPATSFTFNAGDPAAVTFQFAASPVSTPGPQTIAIAAGAILRASDNGPIKAWSVGFHYDPVPLTVASASLTDLSDILAPVTALRLTFTRDIDFTSVQTGDLSLTVGTVTGVSSIDSRTVEFALSGLTAEGVVEANLGAGTVLDTVGNRTQAWVATYLLDRVDGAFPGQMMPLGPAGTQAYRGRTTGYAGTVADTDRYTINIDAGQALSMAVAPAGDGYRPTVTLLDAGGATVATASASAAGQWAVLNAAPATAGGIYTVVVGSAAANGPYGGGVYTLELALNAALESEGRSGPANDVQAAAENLDAAFTMPGGVRRAAAIGTLPATVGSADWYKLTVPVGGSPTFVVTGQTLEAQPRIAVYNAGGMLLAGGVTVKNGQAVGGFTAPLAGTYYVRVTGAGGEYLLTVADAAFDLEPNDSAAAAVELGGRRAAIGYASGTPTTISSETERNDDGEPGATLTDMLLANDVSGKWSRGINDPVNQWKTGTISGTISAPLDGDWDFYRFFAGPGDALTTAKLRTAPGSGVLNPYLRLFDNMGNLLAFDDETGGGQSDAQISFSDFQYVGDYYIVPDAFHKAVSPGYLLELTLVTPTLRRSAAPDYYKLTLAAGQTVTLRTTTPADGLGEFSNTLDPAIDLLSPSGTTVGTNDNSGTDGRNALLTYTAPTQGIYTVAVRASGSTRGEYVLTVADGGTTTPGATGTPNLVAASDSGPLSDDDITGLATGLQFLVPGVTPGATVTIYDGATQIGSALAATDSVVVTMDVAAAALANGVHTITARQTMPASPTSVASKPLAVAIDVTPPVAPTVAPDLRSTSDTGVSSTDDLTNDSTPAFDVTTAEGYFRVYLDGQSVGGIFGPGTSFTLPELSDGPHTIAVSAVDLAGNESATSPVSTVTIDTVAPDAPGTPDLRSVADSGISDTDNLTNVQLPSFDVSTAAGTYLRLYRGSILASVPYASAPLTASVPQPDGAWAYTARAVDAAGNASVAGPALNVTIDTLAWAPAVSGGVDPTWGGSGYAVTAISTGRDRIEDLVLMPDNRVLAVGQAADPVTGYERFALAMYLPNGTLDPAFGTGGITCTNILAASIAYDAVLQPDGKILVTGTANTTATATSRGPSRMILARYTPDGMLDTTFGTGGVGYVITMIGGTMTNAVAITRQLDGMILVSGDANDATTDFAIARYTANGVLDSTWGLNGKVETDFGSVERANAVLVQADGKVVAVGTTFVGAPSGQAIAIARYNIDGSLDTTYGTGGRKVISLGYTPDVAYDAVLAFDGKVIIAGSRSSQTFTDSFLLRLNTDGSIDESFGVNGLALVSLNSGYDWFTDVTLQADGRIVATGAIAGQSDMTVARFLSDGSLDPTFGSGGKLIVNINGNLDISRAVTVQRDGKILLGGYSRTNVSGSFDAFAVVRIGDGQKMKSPRLRLTSDTGTPGDNVTSASALAFDLEPAENFFRFYQDGQQLAGGFQGGTAYTATATSSGTFGYAYTTVDAAGNESGLSELVQVTVTLVPPAVQSVVLDSGNAQRSKVTSATVTFDRPVAVDAGAFTIVGRSGAGPDTTVVFSNPSNDGMTWLLTFTGTSVVAGSLADGIYDLTIVASKVHTGSPAGPAMAANFGATFHRLFSDVDGDGDSDNADLFQMRQTYSKFTGDAGFNAAFDYDGDGDVDNADVFQVRSRRAVEFKGYWNGRH